MRLFWMAWSFAICLVLIGLGLTAWVFASSEHWPDAMQLIVRMASLVVSLAAFVGAFRLALLATGALRAVLAQNLAAVIVMELNDLRQATQRQAAALAGDAGADADRTPFAPLPPTDALQIPRFFGERKDIRKLLGPATEHMLEQLLLSLESYNRIIAEASEQQVQNSTHLLWHEISVVQERLKLATRQLAPFCLAS